ncbi:acylamino-acid-releasing enzyme, partial [Quercus suber]
MFISGASKPFEAIFVSSNSKKSDTCDPLIVFLHGGPHTVSLSSFSKGSLGFGEEALQSLPGKVGEQDVNDVLTAIDHIIEKGLASPSKITVLGGSHGGFLTTHLIGQAPDRFVAAAVRNPACNLALMVGTTDIPDWCYVEACGSKGKDIFSEAPSADYLTLFHSKSPISHLSKDVNDVLTAIDHIIEKGLASPSKITVLGGSHGGFLTTHLIGQAPDRFVAAAVRNPACNLALMVGTTDIPDWCYVEACGSKGKDIFSEAPSADYLTLFHSKSPISHLSKVKTPILFLLGAQDLRVPVSNGLQ